jgi:type I restriction enzyme S subunit
LAEKDKATIKLHVLGQIGQRKRKPNETTWLPDLPADWPIQRCAHIFRNLDHQRIPLNSEQRADLEKIYPYYGASGVIDYVDRFIFDGDNILVGEDGANLVLQSTPIAFKASGQYWVNNHAHILQPRFGVLDYWVHALNQVPYEIYVTGSAQPKLTSESLGNIRLPCPPTDEQEQILKNLEDKRRSLVRLREPINRSIDRMREFRSALITAAVTGQIDVTTWGKRGETDRRLDQIAEEMAADAGGQHEMEARA